MANITNEEEVTENGITLIITTFDNGDEIITELDTAANSTANVTISNVAPDAVSTATISKWLQITIEGDGTYFLPMWT